MKKITYILSLFAIILLSACSSIDCKLNGSVLCHIAIQDENGEDATLAYPLTVTLNRTMTDGDTVYINSLSQVSTFDIPLSYTEEVDNITLSLDIEGNTISDVVSIKKTNEPYFESVDCAARYNHELQEVSSTNNFIKEIVINKSRVSNESTTTNIYIRLRGSN